MVSCPHMLLAGEMLAVATDFMQQRMHATVVINAYTQALDDLLTHMASISVPIDITNRDEMLKIIGSCIGTKIMNKWSVERTLEIEPLHHVQVQPCMLDCPRCRVNRCL